MKVKIGNEIYDSDEVPIMLILSKEDKELITQQGEFENMCFYPDKEYWTKNEYEEIKVWMGIE